MDQHCKERMWPYVVLAIGLLVLSMIVPRYWRGQYRGPLPADGFAPWAADSHSAADFSPADVVPVPHSPLPVGRVTIDDAELDRATVVAPVAKRAVSLSPQHAAAGRQAWQPLAEAAPAEQDVADDAGHSETTSTLSGRMMPFGPLVAGRDEASAANAEVLPPVAALPQMQSKTAPPCAARLARRTMADSSNNGEAITVWPRPAALIEQLRKLQGDARSEQWARDVLAALDELARVPAIDSQPSRTTLARLTRLAPRVQEFVLEVQPSALQAEVLAAAEALNRRVIVWQIVQRIAGREEPLQFAGAVSGEQLLRQIDSAAGSIPGDLAPRQWRQFLQLDELDALLRDEPVDLYERARAARQVLERLHSPRLNKRQRQLLKTEPIEQLSLSLREAATEPVDVLELIYAVEQYEQSLAMPDGRRLAAQAARYRWTTDEDVAELIRRLDANYRSPNVRVSATGELLNRLLPQEETIADSVGEQIFGAYVSGERLARTRLSLQLIPDDDQWRLGLEAHGQTSSSTATHAGNATLFTQGQGEFSARKLFVVDRHRVHVWPAEAEATYHGQLQGVSTRLDMLPLVSRMAQNSATEQYYANQELARQEVEARLRRRAAALLDEQAHEPLVAAEAQLQKNLLIPLNNVAVEPTPMKLYTSPRRIVGHYRMAGLHQLGGHTPRPWAPADSLLSVQIHETAINNVIDGLQLDGRQDHLHTLYRDIWASFGVDDVEIPESMPRDVVVRFADEEAVRIRLQDGRMEVILQLAELRADRRVWRDLVVRNYYAPDTSSRRALLVRDSSVRLRGARLGVRDQIALRGVFSKIFGNNDQFPLVGRKLAEHPGVQDLGVSQYIIRDGWIGLAWGPPRSVNEDAVEGGSLDRAASRLQPQQDATR